MFQGDNFQGDDLMEKEKHSFNDLIEIMSVLRSEKGCPWDRVQNHETLKKYLIEETYEVLDAIELNDRDKLCEELGDVLLQVVFHAKIASDSGDFDITDVIDGICRKMVSRHTHVFGGAKAHTPDEVLVNWEKIKKNEKGQNSTTEVMKDVPKCLPALMRGYKVQKIAAKAGFDWDNIEDVFKKVREEIGELEEVYKGQNEEKITEEIGDLLFSVVNLSRFLGIQPELAITATTNKFIDRFEYVEKKALENGLKLEEMTLKEMDAFWDEAKVVLPERHSEEKHSVGDGEK
jgi:tetrapyrrole methylase family protein/MazG family protein